MLPLEFAKIKIHDGSQDNGFEELICQLAHLCPPENSDYFVRKEGAGGDAGVECYWKLKDGSEHAWQAKFFLDTLESSQWSQISESVNAALEKHPSITKYYVCLPRDWTDSRKKAKGGKKVNSAWDKWEEHTVQWERTAKEKGMDVEFKYWCKHEISQMLQTDDPHFSGRSLYWFNEPVIQLDKLNSLAKKSRNSLGERFTPEYHLDLPIAHQFDGLGLTADWGERIIEQKKALSQVADVLVRKFFKETDLFSEIDCWSELRDNFISLHDQFLYQMKNGSFLENVPKLATLSSKIIELSGQCSNTFFSLKEGAEDKGKKAIDGLSREFYEQTDKIYKFKSFLKSKSVSSARSKAALLLGEAGIGKSHLLCDLSLKRLERGLPTLFLLGQHYGGGNPCGFVLDALDLNGNTYSQVLGALDAAGEAKKSRTLIVIDAINEGAFRDEWYDNIVAFISDLSAFPHLSILISCRNTYSDYLIPESAVEDLLTRLYHYGFRGYEHRAASIYLSKQGISKPSAPITSPEFSNPLFLKACCKALKENGFSSFPKGLNGISQLFDFYLTSIEKIINRKKRYLPKETAIRTAIDHFVNALYPDHLYGLPIDVARSVIDANDPKSNLGDNLTDLLIDEGLLSLDIAPGPSGNTRGKEVIRFTYERFSDHIIANHIIDKYVVNNDIASVFSENQAIGKMINDDGLYLLGGIIEALGLCVPERFGVEFIDLVQGDKKDNSWIFERTFSEVILWRSPESFTDRTIELLNKLPCYGVRFHATDILLALSTEPDHPWNADFLDKNLRRRKLADRDAFWSTHIAVSDWEEDEDQPESVLRTIIDWSLSANFDEVEMERLRLTAITLLWLTTTSNGRVRDQATKSLARVLSVEAVLIPGLIENFSLVDDPYLVERLFAAIYGAVCNIDDDGEIKSVAEKCFDFIFKGGKPYPYILMRDYARGVLELAHHKKLLPPEIKPEDFRPPYNSDWPIENPSIEDIEELEGTKYSSSIKSSVMGFSGDFGNYSMSCVHHWSPTELTKEKPQSCYELQREFADTLSAELRDRYLQYLDGKVSEERDFNLTIELYLKRLKKMKRDDNASGGIENISPWEALKKEIEESLDAVQKEIFRWVSGLGTNDNSAAFSRKWAQRWVCKKAHGLGWTKELFGEFEKNLSRDLDRSQPNIERIGKKYQWIAFHELLARMSDNLHWIDRGYSDIDDSIFRGPWQIHERDLDPTIWHRKTGDRGYDNSSESAWWQPFKFPFVSDDMDELLSWLWSKEIIPPFPELLDVCNPVDSTRWTVLRGFSHCRKKPETSGDVIPSQEGWFRINPCIIRKQDFSKLKATLQGENLCDPHVLSIFSTGHQGYLKEYPWHPSCSTADDWVEAFEEYPRQIKVNYKVPVCQYEWESGSRDSSLDESISIYLPSKMLIDELGLHHLPECVGKWEGPKGELGFIDPSIDIKGPSCALVRTDLLQSWLMKSDFLLVWLVGGEKQLFTEMATKFYGRHVYSGLYAMTEEGIKGDLWFIKEPGPALEGNKDG